VTAGHSEQLSIARRTARARAHTRCPLCHADYVEERCLGKGPLTPANQKAKCYKLSATTVPGLVPHIVVGYPAKLCMIQVGDCFW
jgi:hypothetical protein